VSAASRSIVDLLRNDLRLGEVLDVLIASRRGGSHVMSEADLVTRWE
jgi:hypothetical protein